MAGSPFPTEGGPFSVEVDLLGRFVYVTNSGDDTVSAYRIGENGTLTSVAGGLPLLSGRPPGL